MDKSISMLQIVHGALKVAVPKGGVCVDATAGRGRDTAYLCELVGESGKVYAFDIQQEALASCEKFLKERGLCARLILDSHENMAKYIGADSVDAITFNLGYLPGGDHRIFTRFESTRKAIESGLYLLKSGGLMTVCVYYGGDSGYEERDALMPWLKTLDSKKYQALTASFYNWDNDPPFPVFIKKL